MLPSLSLRVVCHVISQLDSGKKNTVGSIALSWLLTPVIVGLVLMPQSRDRKKGVFTAVLSRKKLLPMRRHTSTCLKPAQLCWQGGTSFPWSRRKLNLIFPVCSDEARLFLDKLQKGKIGVTGSITPAGN